MSVRGILRGAATAVTESPVQGDASGYPYVNPETAALVARFTDPCPDARKALIDATITSAKVANIWDACVGFYVTAQYAQQAACQNWKQNLYNLTPAGLLTFLPDRHFAGDGVTGYLDTGFDPLVGGLPQNSTHLSAWNRLSRAANTQVLAGCRRSINAFLDVVPRFTGDLGVLRANSGAGSGANALSAGDFLATRTGAGALAGYRNGVAVFTSAAASVAPIDANILLLASGVEGGAPIAFCQDQLAAATFGTGLDATQGLALYNDVLLPWMTAVGA